MKNEIEWKSCKENVENQYEQLEFDGKFITIMEIRDLEMDNFLLVSYVGERPW